ncbi:Protein SMAX1-LIKE 4 [Camellia lanceoleosa]|uniref:Protein SMAX1-LIKE 4 n=1 Tax=Camellia lanceoleosa TaxID=1840588 RepID=A0ACC0I416_9ERIC|nr:Protein SMAX1-LIKE 4 [Camellia lanceoleosa]
MRTGACTVQQTLTSEAASVLKHSLGLARRRGHAQVTPLHVASTLLTPSPRPSLLKRACLKSQPQTNSNSHPLQYCRALELCFNVALNRLPTTPGPLLQTQPSLSNALIAALKRAQAHQRRGCIEQQQQQQQQQPLLAIKVELEQLILSILDDPSVSRVMREAGFSSTAVKNNLEDSSSSASSVFQCYSTISGCGGGGGVYSSPCSPSHQPNNSFWKAHLLSYNSESNPLFFSPQNQKKLNNPLLGLTDSEDIKLVFEVLLRKKRRNTVIVGDSVSITEGLVGEVMGKIEKGDVPYDELKSTHFIKFQFSSVPLRFMRREEVEMNLSDLKRKVDSLIASGKGGVIIYTGDLKWTVEDSTRTVVVASDDYNYVYNPVDHLVAEIGRLISDYSNSNTKVWLMATANYQTYMRCQMKQPSLEIQWSLQAVSVPSGGLGLSLPGHATTTSVVHESKISSFSQNPSKVVLETKAFSGKEEDEDNYNKLTCCVECTSKYEKEAQAHELIKSAHHKSSLYLSTSNCGDTKGMDKASSTQLPYWLQSHAKDELVELRRKWNRLCHSQHQQGRHNQNPALEGSISINNQSFSAKTYNYNTSSSTSPSYPWWPNPNNNNNVFPDSNSISFVNSTLKPSHNASSFPRFRRQNSCHIEFSFGNERNNQKHQSVEQPNLDSLKNTTQGKEVKITLALGNCQFSDPIGKLADRKAEICKQLQDNVPWQFETISSIVEALIEFESNSKPINWLLIQGSDSIGKRRLARGIAESVFGSADLILHMKMRERYGKKMSPCCGKLERALSDHEKIVVLLEDVDFADTQFLKFLADGFETGKIGENQAIIILTKGDSDSTCYGDDAEEDPNFVTQIKLEVSETIPNSFDDKKRKAEWDLSNKAKSPRMEERENFAYSIKKEFTRQSSSNTLDLNIKADDDKDNDDDDEEDAKLARDLSPISSDLTREMGNDIQNPHGFLELIKNQFVFNRDLTHDKLIKEMVLSKIKGCFDAEGDLGGCFLFSGVEEKLLEELLIGSGTFLNSLFEKWLKEVFQRSLQMVKIGGKEKLVSVRLCLGRKGGESRDGFMGSSLPKKIQVSFIG